MLARLQKAVVTASEVQSRDCSLTRSSATGVSVISSSLALKIPHEAGMERTSVPLFSLMSLRIDAGRCHSEGMLTKRDLSLAAAACLQEDEDGEATVDILVIPLVVGGVEEATAADRVESEVKRSTNSKVNMWCNEERQVATVTRDATGAG